MSEELKSGELEMIRSENLANLAKTLIDIGADAKEARIRAEEEPKVVMVYDRPHLYKDGELEEIPVPEPVREYRPDVFTPYTLQGLIDWLKADTDKLFTPDKPAALVVVESPNCVSVYSELRGSRKERVKYAECRYNSPRIPLNEFVDSETLGVIIQTCVLQDDYRDAVLKVVNNMKAEQSERTSDDGISQRVTVSAGVAEVDTTIFKNPAWLRPMRTFTEVSQPISAFVVRFKEGKRAALFEADGGKWKTEAVQTVATFLKDALKGLNLVVIG